MLVISFRCPNTVRNTLCRVCVCLLLVSDVQTQLELLSRLVFGIFNVERGKNKQDWKPELAAAVWSCTLAALHICFYRYSICFGVCVGFWCEVAARKA